MLLSILFFFIHNITPYDTQNLNINQSITTKKTELPTKKDKKPNPSLALRQRSRLPKKSAIKKRKPVAKPSNLRTKNKNGIKINQNTRNTKNSRIDYNNCGNSISNVQNNGHTNYHTNDNTKILTNNNTSIQQQTGGGSPFRSPSFNYKTNFDANNSFNHQNMNIKNDINNRTDNQYNGNMAQRETPQYNQPAERQTRKGPKQHGYAPSDQQNNTELSKSAGASIDQTYVPETYDNEDSKSPEKVPSNRNSDQDEEYDYDTEQEEINSPIPYVKQNMGNNNPFQSRRNLSYGARESDQGYGTRRRNLSSPYSNQHQEMNGGFGRQTGNYSSPYYNEGFNQKPYQQRKNYSNPYATQSYFQDPYSFFSKAGSSRNQYTADTSDELGYGGNWGGNYNSGNTHNNIQNNVNTNIKHENNDNTVNNINTNNQLGNFVGDTAPKYENGTKVGSGNNIAKVNSE
ncbi:hypothetical protein CDIK_1221 [Cucumispora dikerogammari]|nr:hypothetical protein CDIK_1221 [Cucumispora dikerogammari]